MTWWKEYGTVIIYTAAALALLIALRVAYNMGADHKDAQWQGKWAIAAHAAIADAQEKEHALQTELDNVRTEGRKHEQDLQSRVAVLNTQLDSLRLATSAYAISNTSTSTTDGSEATAGPINLLADLYRKSIDRNAELAAYADAARGAGLTCERAYEAVRAVN